MSAITLEGELYMIEQDRAFKGEDVVRFLKHLMRQIEGKLLVIWETALRSTALEQSRTSSKAERLAECNWSNCPVMLRISTPTKESGGTSSSAWS